MGAVSAHDRAYLLYRVGPRTFDLYVFNWETEKCCLVEKDGRVNPAVFAYLIPHESGIAIVCAARGRLFLLSQEGAFQSAINIRDVLDPEERTFFAAPGPDLGKFYLTTRKDERDFYSLFDIKTGSRETLYMVPDRGGHYIMPSGDGGHIAIKTSVARLLMLGADFQPTGERPALFEEPGGAGGARTILFGGKPQFMRNPYEVDGRIIMEYIAHSKDGRLYATATLGSDGIFKFSAYRPLAVSPDGSKKMVYDHEKDLVTIVPVDFTYPVTRIPPVSGDHWPPK